jgi:putative transposase
MRWTWRSGPAAGKASSIYPGWCITAMLDPNTSQYTSITFTERLAQAGIAPSVGSVGDALDNPWRGLDDVELATLEWVDWHNHRRLHSACHDLTPAEYELIHYGQHPALTEAGVTTT